MQANTSRTNQIKSDKYPAFRSESERKQNNESPKFQTAEQAFEKFKQHAKPLRFVSLNPEDRSSVKFQQNWFNKTSDKIEETKKKTFRKHKEVRTFDRTPKAESNTKINEIRISKLIPIRDVLNKVTGCTIFANL